MVRIEAQSSRPLCAWVTLGFCMAGAQYAGGRKTSQTPIRPAKGHLIGATRVQRRTAARPDAAKWA